MLKLVIALLAAAPAAALACPAPDGLLYYADGCDGAAKAALRLLPEDGLLEGARLEVTGAYTAADSRENAKPKPVGLFVRDGEVVSREFAPIDGVALIGPDGALDLHHRARVAFAGKMFDLNEASARARFLDAAAAAGASLFQSHLVIVDGAVDAQPVDGAPRVARRILFEGPTGAIGVFDSSGRALTLHEAAAEVAARYAPEMALNLDMGSYDFCRAEGELCGVLSLGGTGKLSNVLTLGFTPEGDGTN